MITKKENKIISVQDMLFKEMQRIDATENLESKEAKEEYDRATALYNMSSTFIKSINTNIAIMNLSKKTNTKYEKITKQLGL